MLAFFLGPIGRWIGGLAVIGAVLTGIYAKGNLDGRHAVQAKWDAAIQADIAAEKEARARAEKQIGNDTVGEKNDPFNRDTN